MMRPAAMTLVTGLVCVATNGSAATLSIERDQERARFETAELLARPDAKQILIPADVAYGTSSRYRAIPLAALLSSLPPPPGRTLETVARDGYAAQIPMELAYSLGGAGPQILAHAARHDQLLRVLLPCRSTGDRKGPDRIKRILQKVGKPLLVQFVVCIAYPVQRIVKAVREVGYRISSLEHQMYSLRRLGQGRCVHAPCNDPLRHDHVSSVS